LRNLSICIIKTSKEVKQLFNKLPLSIQHELLNELLSEHELQGRTLEEAKLLVNKQRKKIPCHHCSSENSKPYFSEYFFTFKSVN